MAKVTARASYAPTPKLLLPMLQSVVLFGALFGGGWALGVPSGYLALYGFAAFAVTMVVLGVTVPLYRRMGRRSVQVSLDGALLAVPKGTIDLSSSYVMTLTAAQQTLWVGFEQPMPLSIVVARFDRARASSHYPFASFIAAGDKLHHGEPVAHRDRAELRRHHCADRLQRLRTVSWRGRQPQTDRGGSCLRQYARNPNGTYNVVMVRNAGAYASGWWWYVGQTVSSLTNHINTNNARIIDLDHCRINASTARYGAVLRRRDDRQHCWCC